MIQVKIKKSDYELIELFSDKEEPFAKEAFKDFHERHASFVANECYKFCNVRFQEEIKAHAADLSQLVFQKIFFKAGSFKPKKTIPQNEIIFYVRKWLYRIIERTFIDEYVRKLSKSHSTIYINEDNQDEVAWKIHKNSEASSSKLTSESLHKYELINSAMQKIKISDKETTILKSYLQSALHDEKNNWCLPELVMSELEVKLNLKKNSIIQAKNRLINKIKAELNVN